MKLEECLMENREIILEAALNLFYTRGYDAVGVQEIAERSGITKPTLYYYFKSKYGLLEQLLESRGGPFMQELHEACVYRGDLKITLEQAAGVMAGLAKRDPEFFTLFVALYHSPRGNEAYRAVRPLVLRLQRETEAVFEAASGQLGNMHGRQRQFSLGFIGLVFYYIVMKFEISGDGLSIEISGQEISSLVHQFMHGIYS